jgi:uncharacterized protein
MDVKSSKYNIYLTENKKFYVYNQLTQSLSEIDEKLYFQLKENQTLDNIDNEEKYLLKKKNFICDYALQEELIMLRLNRIKRYGNHYARLTIMPTLNCNFKCWYCYESHIESKMDATIKKSVILFAEKLLKKNKLLFFELGWFGGEPLLFFDDVMFPIANSIKKLCANENVRFGNQITTNGYLITKEMIKKFNQIHLNSFQITLDGSEKYHNKSRFSIDDRKTYDTIVANITSLCEGIDNVRIALRINYSPKNLNSISEIATSFPPSMRHKIFISPQIIWQYKDEVNEITDEVFRQLKVFQEQGYQVEQTYLPSNSGIGCYVENMLQYVINYDGKIFKCTARDFDSKNSIGELNQDGEFVFNSNYYKYFVSSFFENPTCEKCEVLPSCTGMCLQKRIESGLPKCPKESIYSSIINQLKLIILKDKTREK